jgi:hypothetical protein
VGILSICVKIFIGVLFFLPSNLFPFSFSHDTSPIYLLIGNIQELNAVYEAALIAKEDKAAGKTVQLQMCSSKRTQVAPSPSLTRNQPGGNNDMTSRINSSPIELAEDGLVIYYYFIFNFLF